MKLPKISKFISGCNDTCNTTLSEIKEDLEDVGVTTLTVDFLMRFACLNGQSELVKLLLKTTKGLDLNKSLLDACKDGLIEIAILLIEHGADAFSEALAEAGEKGHAELVDAIVDKISNPYNLEPDKMEVADVVDTTRYLNAGLIGACKGGNIGIIKGLVDRGATNLIGALRVACRENKQDVVKCLLDLGPALWVTSVV